jgi:hypothetical protein
MFGVSILITEAVEAEAGEKRSSLVRSMGKPADQAHMYKAQKHSKTTVAVVRML